MPFMLFFDVFFPPFWVFVWGFFGVVFFFVKAKPFLVFLIFLPFLVFFYPFFFFLPFFLFRKKKPFSLFLVFALFCFLGFFLPFLVFFFFLPLLEGFQETKGGFGKHRGILGMGPALTLLFFPVFSTAAPWTTAPPRSSRR